MAKFIFKMESILSVKTKLEDQAKAEYGIETMKLREEEHKLCHFNNPMPGFPQKEPLNSGLFLQNQLFHKHPALKIH